MLSSIALVAVLSVHGAPTVGFTALDLLKECRGVMKDKPSDSEAIAGVHCMGYLAGVSDAHSISVAANPSARLWCEPAGGLVVEQRVRVVVKHLESAPEHLHQTARSEVVVAHAKAFPCAVKISACDIAERENRALIRKIEWLTKAIAAEGYEIDPAQAEVFERSQRERAAAHAE